MIPRRFEFIRSEEEHIYYEALGLQDREAIVFCHGLGGNHAIWFQQAPAFARDYYVVTWDQRGFGRSTNHTGQAGPTAGVRDLRCLMDRLAIDRAHVVGQSMGGWAALGYGLECPQRIFSLTLADTIGGIFTPEIEKAFDRSCEIIAASPAEAQPLGCHPALGKRLAENDPARTYLYQLLGGFNPPPPRDIFSQLRATAYRSADLHALQTPVLFIMGSDDDLFPPWSIRMAAARLTGSRVVEIPTTGHSPYFEAPELFNRELRRFFGEVGG